MTEDQAVELALLRAEMESMKSSFNDHRKESKQDFVDLSTKVQGLVDAWNTATGLVRFVKWAASLATAAGILFGLVKGFGK